MRRGAVGYRFLFLDVRLRVLGQLPAVVHEFAEHLRRDELARANSDVFESLLHLLRRLIAEMDVLVASPGDDLVELGRSPEPRETRRIVVQQRMHRGCFVLPPEEGFARQHFVEHDTGREHIRAPIHEVPAKLLRRHVRQLAFELADRRVVDLCRGVGHAEVEEFRHTSSGDHDVLGAHVAVHDSQ